MKPQPDSERSPQAAQSPLRNFLASGALLVFSLLVTFSIGELAARIAFPHIANYNLEMWRYFSIFKQVHDNPRLPFSLKPHREAHLYGVDVRTNALGLRDREYEEAKPAGVHRILVVGDSQTFGWGIEERDAISEVLERKLNENGERFEVINFGVGNYNSMMEVEQFRLKGLPLDPDMVILVYFVNDAEAPPYISKWRFELTRHSYLFAVAFDRYVRLKTRLSPHFNWLDYYKGLYVESNPWLAPNRLALQDLADLCRDRGIRLMVANYPDLHEFKPYPLPEATAYVKEFAEANKLAFVDFVPVLENLDPPSLWVSPEDPHGNPRVTYPVADLLYEQVMKTDWSAP